MQKLLRDRQHAPLRHARAAQRPRVLQNQNRIRRHVQIVAIDARVHVRRSCQNTTAGPVCCSNVGSAADGLDHRAVRRKIAVKNRGAAALGKRIRRAGG